MGAAENVCSGPPIAHLKMGWAKFPFGTNRVHYWTEDTKTMPAQIRDGGRVRYYEAKCGLLNVSNARVPALHEGNWPRCKRCLRKLKGEDDGSR